MVHQAYHVAGQVVLGDSSRPQLAAFASSHPQRSTWGTDGMLLIVRAECPCCCCSLRLLSLCSRSCPPPAAASLQEHPGPRVFRG